MRFIELLIFSSFILMGCESQSQAKSISSKTSVDNIESTEKLRALNATPVKSESVVKATGDNLVDIQQAKKYKKDKEENHQKITKKYGEQWDFCKCVKANDSINLASQKNLSEPQAEKLMLRWEQVENKCKEFMTNPNTTPEERAIHERKVKKCLRSR